MSDLYKTVRAKYAQFVNYYKRVLTAEDLEALIAELQEAIEEKRKGE